MGWFSRCFKSYTVLLETTKSIWLVPSPTQNSCYHVYGKANTSMYILIWMNTTYLFILIPEESLRKRIFWSVELLAKFMKVQLATFIE